MKLCYVDESGNNESDPCLVMVGILVDAARLNRTRKEFGGIFESVQKLFPEPLKELKGSKMIAGRARWRSVSPDVRKQLASHLCNWIKERKHSLLLTAVDRKAYAAHKAPSMPSDGQPLWVAAGFHIALQLQKENQKHSNNKGHTFLVFDENKMAADQLSELLWEPPGWTDDYYGRKKKQEAMDQLIDTAFTAKSHQAGLVQVADLFAYLLRRYAELNDYAAAEEWEGEKSFVAERVGCLAGTMLPCSNRWATKTSSACAKWYTRLAPASLRELGV
jgi:hypothetical protein